MVEVGRQAGEIDVTNYVAPMRCGDEVGMNDRGVFVPEGMTREEIVFLGDYLKEEFEISKYLARDCAIDIIKLLRALNSERRSEQNP
jgi:hypothetical protein